MLNKYCIKFAPLSTMKISTYLYYKKFASELKYYKNIIENFISSTKYNKVGYEQSLISYPLIPNYDTS